MILPIGRGGKNLQSPSIKSKALFIANFLKHSSNNPFIQRFITFMNPPQTNSFPKIPYLKFALSEICYIPSHLIPSIKPKILYQFYLANTTKVWKNINNKILSSQVRSIWYRLVNKKLPMKEILFNQNITTSPICTECNQQNESHPQIYQL
jgi:zinc-binding in reverse transcriptase